MIYLRFVVCILLVKGLQAVKETQVKVCHGDPVKLFCSIQINNDTIVSLYRITDEQSLIATWSIQLNTTNGPEYSGRLSIDGSNTLWILNVHPSDEGNYLLLQKEMEANSSTSAAVELYVMFAPDTICKPIIKELDYNIMRAYLEADSCGKPRVSVYWQEHYGVEHKGKDVAKLQSGKEKGTYYACIEGPALTCNRRSNKSADHCSAFTIKEKNSESSGETIALTTTIGNVKDPFKTESAITAAPTTMNIETDIATSTPSGETTTTTTMTTSGNLRDTLQTQSRIEETTTAVITEADTDTTLL